MNILRFSTTLLMLTISGFSFAGTAYFSEPAGSVRFEQYIPSPLALWRMPSPGTSTFPGGNCKNLIIGGGDTQTNRFFSLYLFLKANGGEYFVYYETSTCQVVSFGLNG